MVHCVKSVCIPSFSCPYFPAFGLNTEMYGVSLRVQSECGKIRTRKTRKTGTFHAMVIVGTIVGTYFKRPECSLQVKIKSKISSEYPRFV